MRGLDVLRRHEVEWNALTTVNSANGDHGHDVYRFLRDDLGARHIQFIPIVERVTPQMLPLAEAGWGHRSGLRHVMSRGWHAPSGGGQDSDEPEAAGS